MLTVPKVLRLESVPGFPGWRYSASGYITKDVKDKDGAYRPAVQLEWCPRVSRHMVIIGDDGEILSRQITVTLGDESATITPKDLRDGRIWDHFPSAVGTHKRILRDVLAHIVENEAAKIPRISAIPRWQQDRMELPPTGLLNHAYLTAVDDEAEALTSWRAIAKIAARNPRLALILGFSGGAPYLAAESSLSCKSFWVHLVGDTSLGKSTAARVAASMYGYPGDGGVVQDWNLSEVALNESLGRLGFLPAFRDEIQTAKFKPAQLESTVLTSTGTASKTRTDMRNGGTTSAPTWKGILFSTGNISVLGVIRNPAMFPRVIEIPAPIVDSGATADDLDELALSGYGWPFRWMCAKGLRPDTVTAERDFPLASGGVARRLGKSMLWGLAGASCLADLLSVPELYPAALEAARSITGQMLEELQEMGAKQSDRLIEAISEALSSRPGAFPARGGGLSDWNRFDGFDVRGEADIPGDVAILPMAIKAIAEAGELTDVRSALRDLKLDGRLVVTDSSGYRYRLRIGHNTPWTYLFRLDDSGSLTGDSEPDSGNNGNKHALPPSDQGKQCSHSDTENGNSAGTALPLPVPAIAAAESAEALLKAEPVPCLTCGNATPYRVGGLPYSLMCAPGPLDLAEQEQEQEQEQALPVRRRRALSADIELHPAHQANFNRLVRRRYPDATDQDLRLALIRFMATMEGLEFRGSAAIVGTLLFEIVQNRFKDKIKGDVKEVPLLKFVPPHTRSGLVNDANGILPRVDTSPGWIVSVDVNHQYLAAAGSLPLGTGEPEAMTGAEALRPKIINTCPGYLRLLEPVQLTPWTAPIPAGKWITSPLAKLAVQRHQLRPELVDEAWMWTDSRRWLETWVEAVRPAVMALKAQPGKSALYALAALKGVYAAFLGGQMRSEKHNRTRSKRTDWQDMIVGTSWANFLRNLARGKHQPFCVVKDTAYYIVDNPRATIAGLTYSAQPGKFKSARYARITPAIQRAIDRSLPFKVRDTVKAEYEALESMQQDATA